MIAYTFQVLTRKSNRFWSNNVNNAFTVMQSLSITCHEEKEEEDKMSVDRNGLEP